jgi:hypothetical protein
MKPPISALPILEARMKGFKPADMVIVSMVGRLRESNPTVYVNGPNHDWLFVKGLEICLFCDKHCKWRETLEAIMAQEPVKTSLWDVLNRQGAWCYYLPTLRAVERGILPFAKELSFIPWNDRQNMEFAWN